MIISIFLKSANGEPALSSVQFVKDLFQLNQNCVYCVLAIVLDTQLFL